MVTDDLPKEMPPNLKTIYTCYRTDCIYWNIIHIFYSLLWWLRYCKVRLPVRLWDTSPHRILAACSLARNIKLTGCSHWFKSLFARDLGNKDNNFNFWTTFSFVSLISKRNISVYVRMSVYIFYLLLDYTWRTVAYKDSNFLLHIYQLK